MNDGAQILKGLSQTRKFFQQVALLVRTAEEQLGKAGWESIGGKSCSNLTSDYLRPERWMPRDIYRFYFKNSDDEDAGNEGFVIYIGVIMDQEKAWAGFTEPWISCAIYRFSPGFDTRDFKYWDWAGEAAINENEPDGLFYDEAFTDEDDRELLSQHLMALPLTRVTDAETLNQLIVSPLLNEVDKIRHSL